MTKHESVGVLFESLEFRHWCFVIRHCSVMVLLCDLCVFAVVFYSGSKMALPAGISPATSAFEARRAIYCATGAKQVQSADFQNLECSHLVRRAAPANRASPSSLRALRSSGTKPCRLKICAGATPFLRLLFSPFCRWCS